MIYIQLQPSHSSYFNIVSAYSMCSICNCRGDGRYIGIREKEEGRKESEKEPFILLIISLGIVFNNLDGDDIEYTLRLRHEVGSRDTWFTRITAPVFQLAGPRVAK